MEEISDTFKAVLVGFPIQHDNRFTDHINEEYFKNVSWQREILEKVGKEVTPLSKHRDEEITEDLYVWFSSLEFPIIRGAAKILFPYKGKDDNRGVSVYSQKDVPEDAVMGITKSIAFRMQARTRPYIFDMILGFRL